jgi:hypothetical protein
MWCSTLCFAAGGSFLEGLTTAGNFASNAANGGPTAAHRPGSEEDSTCLPVWRRFDPPPREAPVAVEDSTCLPVRL